MTVVDRRRSPTPNRVMIGDALTSLRTLPTASVDCVVTSPPYFALRDYGVAGQLGLEATIVEWVDNLLAVMTEIGRVLTPSGTVWLNLGDSYSRGMRWGATNKSLLLGPERLLLALSVSGWIVRNKIVWSKTNPMPTSVRDRLATSWEPLYLLTRSPSYYFDLDAIRVPHRSTREKGPGRRQSGRPAWAGPLAGDQNGLQALHARGLVGHPLGKNPGDVWRTPSSNYRGDHHATFPEALIEPCIKAGCPAQVCSRCGQSWRRARAERALGHLSLLGELGPSCGCDSASRPGVVLDPFLGSGTTAVVAERLGRDWLGIELNQDYAALAERRIEQARLQGEQEQLSSRRKEVRHA